VVSRWLRVAAVFPECLEDVRRVFVLEVVEVRCGGVGDWAEAVVQRVEADERVKAMQGVAVDDGNGGRSGGRSTARMPASPSTSAPGSASSAIVSASAAITATGATSSSWNAAALPSPDAQHGSRHVWPLRRGVRGSPVRRAGEPVSRSARDGGAVFGGAVPCLPVELKFVVGEVQVAFDADAGGVPR
jgi:hypothetical protein